MDAPRPVPRELPNMIGTLQHLGTLTVQFDDFPKKVDTWIRSVEIALMP